MLILSEAVQSSGGNIGRSPAVRRYRYSGSLAEGEITW
jgi:hypothetical protein